MSDIDTTQAYQQQPEPAADLRSLDRLVGMWEQSGNHLTGTTTFEWMDGGHFLVQRFDFTTQDGQKITGIEIIGHERPFGAEPGEDLKSRAYTNTGDTLDYVYELEGDTLTIWGGQKGSPAYYRGTFSDDGNVLSGAWHYPGGGGYEAVSTRVPTTPAR
jgi:hypothetical protein